MSVLDWDGTVLAADDVRRAGCRELRLTRRVVITPLAAEELKARGITVTRVAESATPRGLLWLVQADTADPLLRAALTGNWQELSPGELPIVRLSEKVSKGEVAGVVVLTDVPAVAICVANKRKGVRAAAVSTPAQATRAVRELAPNFIAIERPGRTLFELRQILATVAAVRTCPADVAEILQGLEGPPAKPVGCGCSEKGACASRK